MPQFRPSCFASACHVYTSGAVGAGHWIEHINGVAQGGPPYSVTVMPGQSFTIDFRGRGITKPVPPPAQQHDPDVSSVITVESYQYWNVTTGPTWSDNGKTGATPWHLTDTANSEYISNFLNTESRNNKYGTTDDVGDTAGSYTDKNLLASDEVMSATIAPAIYVGAGPHYVTVTALGYHEDYGAVFSSSLITVNVLAPITPVNSPTFTFTPATTPTSTVTPTLVVTPTPLAACGSGTFYFGKNTLGPGGGIRFAMVTALKYNLTQPGTLKTVSLYTTYFSPANLAVACYSDSGGKPATLLSQSAPQAAPSVGAWSTFNMPAVALSPGTYWLAYQQSAFPGTGVPYDFGLFGDTYFFSQPYGAGTFPATVPTPNTTPYTSGFSQQQMPIYAGLCVVAGSPTYTGTLTPSRTASPSPTSSVTPSATASLTPSRTPTASSTASPSATPTASPTHTKTISPSPSDSPTSTGSPTATVTSSSTPSPTATSSGSPTSTNTSTPTPSGTVTLTDSLTPTPPPVGSTVTDTPSISPTFSLSPTSTLTASITPSATPSSTPTGTASATPTSSGTATPTQTPSDTSSATSSASPSATSTPTPTGTSSSTPSPSASATSTDTPTATASPTDTPSSTPSASSSATPTATGTPSITPSFSASPSSSNTPSVTATPSITPSFSASPTYTAGASATSTLVPTPPANSFTAIKDAVLAPNPCTGSSPTLAYRLVSATDNVQVRFYTPGFRLALAADLGPKPAGLNVGALALPVDLANQLYFVQLRARTGRQEATSAVLQFYVLR